jgi:hypothetical protein
MTIVAEGMMPAVIIEPQIGADRTGQRANAAFEAMSSPPLLRRQDCPGWSSSRCGPLAFAKEQQPARIRSGGG